MKILKYLFFLLLIVFIAGAIYFATKDGHYEVEESLVIEAPVEVVFKKVNDYRTWEDWGPWKQEDPTMVFNYPENTSGEGANYSWNGKDSDGSMLTTEVIENSIINQEITFDTPAGERKATVYWIFTPVENGTKVTWGLRGEHTITDKAYFTLTGYDFDQEMHTMYQSGLEGLSASVKRDMEVYSIKVDGITQYSGGFYMYTTAATTREAITSKIEQLLKKVQLYMEGNEITIVGKPMTIYNEWDEANGNAIISCGFPTTTRIIVPNDSEVLSGFIPAQTVLKTTLKGNYSNLYEAWGQTEDYLSDNNYEASETSPQFEIYITDPKMQPNPANWVTELYQPIKTEEIE
tara:strand:+ start:14633 stop:15676 length:1044 start_codon:yes stop_codon:yes gene_type:complete